MKNKNYLFKIILYNSTGLCIGVAVAVLAGAHKSLVLAIAGTVTAAQLYLFAYENIKLKMAALTAVHRGKQAKHSRNGNLLAVLEHPGADRSLQYRTD